MNLLDLLVLEVLFNADYFLDDTDRDDLFNGQKAVCDLFALFVHGLVELLKGFLLV